MRLARSKATLAVLVTAAATLSVTTPAAQAAPSASATILSTPGTVHVSNDATYIDVRVTYKCKNTRQVTYYMIGYISQDAIPDISYSIGSRGETGIATAKCTGGKVTQTLRFLRNWWAGVNPDAKPLVDGSADFRFHLDARAAQGTGAGWYDDANPDSVVQRTVTLVAP